MNGCVTALLYIRYSKWPAEGNKSQKENTWLLAILKSNYLLQETRSNSYLVYWYKACGPILLSYKEKEGWVKANNQLSQKLEEHCKNIKWILESLKDTVIDLQAVVSSRKSWTLVVLRKDDAVQFPEVRQRSCSHPHNEVLIDESIVVRISRIKLVNRSTPVQWFSSSCNITIRFNRSEVNTT